MIIFVSFLSLNKNYMWIQSIIKNSRTVTLYSVIVSRNKMSNVCLNKPFLKEDMIQDGKRIITTLNGDRVLLNVTSMFLMSMVDG